MRARSGEGSEGQDEARGELGPCVAAAGGRFNLAPWASLEHSLRPKGGPTFQEVGCWVLQNVGHSMALRARKSPSWRRFSREGSELEAAHAHCTGRGVTDLSGGTSRTSSVCCTCKTFFILWGLSSLLKLSGVDIIITPLSLGGADGLLSTTAGKSSGIVLVFIC